VLLGVLLCASATRAQDCTPSPAGAYSFTASRHARSGRVAIYQVRVFLGGDCSGAPAFATQLGSIRRVAVTDGGVIVTILAARSSHREWSIVRVIAGGERAVDRRLSLDELPGTAALVGTVRAGFDGASVRFSSEDGEASVPFAALDALARERP
jgi:hypothetical protein